MTPRNPPGPLAAPQRDWPIGIFDFGVGGLTVVRQLTKALPHEDLIYLGDTARVPYGTKSPATVIRFACEDAAFLAGQAVKAIVVACNTVSAWALPALEREFQLPIFGVISPGAAAAVARTRNKRIGVIGTKATIRSQAYERAILGFDAGAKVFAWACPLLVPLVEEGWLSRPVTRAVLQIYLAPLLRRQIDTLVLGCTHYPLLKPALQRTAGKRVVLIDSAESCSLDVRQRLDHLRLLSSRRRHGWIRPFVTDEAERFQDIAEQFLGLPTRAAAKVELPGFPGRA